MSKNNHYEICLDIDVKKQYIKSKVKLVYICKKNNINELVFYIHKNLTIHTLTCNKLYKYEVGEETAKWSPFIPESKRIKLYFKEPLSEGETIDIIFEYSGQIKKLEESGVNRITEKWIELGLYSPWFPLSEEFEQAWFKVKISFMQEDYIVVGSTTTKQEDNYWVIEQVVPFADCSFIASKFFKQNCFSSNINNTDIRLYYIDNEHQKIAELLSEKVFGIIDSFIKKFGEINISQYSIIIVPRDVGGGYNRPGLIVLPDLINDKDRHFKYKDGELGHIKYLAHEIAHLWWSKADTTSWEDWLNESFAEYSCLMAVREYFNEQVFNKLIDEYIENSKGLPPIIGLDRGHEKAFDVLYVKGTVLLYELEKEIGKKSFGELLSEIHKNRINNTNEFLEKLLELTDKEKVDEFVQKLEK